MTTSPDGAVVAEVTPEGTTFRPSPAAVSGRVRTDLTNAVVALAVSLALALVPALTPAHPLFYLGALLALVIAVTLACIAAGARRAVAVPLVVGAGGRVTYGDQELFAGWAVGRVYVERVDGGGEDVSYYYRVEASLVTGPLVMFPGPFGGFGTRDAALWFADLVGAALGVRVEEV